MKSDATWLFNWNFLSRILNLKLSVLFLFCAFADESFGVNLEPSAKLWQLLLPTCFKAQSWAWGIYYWMRLVGNWPYLNQRFQGGKPEASKPAGKELDILLETMTHQIMNDWHGHSDLAMFLKREEKQKSCNKNVEKSFKCKHC